MAVTATHLSTATSATNASSYNTPSVSLSANKLVLLAVINGYSSASNVPTVSGASRTWTQIATIVDEAGFRRTTLFRSLSGSANSGALTIDFAGQTQLRCGWSINEFNNVDTTGTNGANAVVQSASQASTGSVSSLTVTLGAFSSVDNATYGACGIGRVASADFITPGSGFTELGEAYTPSEGAIIQTQWKNSNDTSVDWSLTSGANNVGIAVEIKFVSPESASPSLSPSASESPSPSSSVSLSPSSSVSPSSSESLSPSASISSSPSPSSSVSLSPSSSVSSSPSPSSSESLSPSSSPSLSPSPSSSESLSPSNSPSASPSPSSSISLSPSASISSSPSPSSSESLSESRSPSSSPSPSSSVSPSPSSSPSSSPSPSSSVSLSPSSSVSSSVSLSISPSPSAGYEAYTRGNYIALPSNDNDLETNYSSQDYIDVGTDNSVRVAQLGAGEFMIHQFRNFVGDAISCQVHWNGQTDLSPNVSTVYLQIYNQNTTSWETVDTDNTTAMGTDFDLTADIASLTNYVDALNLITCRVYQEAT